MVSSSTKLLLPKPKQQLTTYELSLKESPLASEAALATSVANVVPIRRVSDPDIDASHGHQILASGEDDASVASASSDETSCHPGSQAEEPRTSQNSEETSGSGGPLSFEDLFQKWHSNRVVKRRHASVKAFPSLAAFQGFHESNTAQGYTFGPYFDRWYARQQELSSDALSSSKKRSLPSNDLISEVHSHSIEDASPRPAKKIRIHHNESSSIQQQRNLNSLHKWNAVNALYRSEIVALPASFVPGPYTVIMGRRLKVPGCVHLRCLTDQYAKEYKQSRDALTKSRIVTQILKQIYEKAPIGAFVRCKARRYYEVEDLIAREKIVSELIAGGLQILTEDDAEEDEDEEE
ncbi:MAG: hypothetical protein SGBAC_006642 [Bacillariaceae sp.]